MKKILNILLILLFVSTLFISCPPRVPNPPFPPSDTIPNDSVSDFQLDSIENYVSQEYLINYLPNAIGDTFLYISITDSIVDTLIFTLTFNQFYKNIYYSSPVGLSILEINDLYSFTDIAEKHFCYESKVFIIDFYITVYMSTDIYNDYMEVEYGSNIDNKLNDEMIGVIDYCECTTKDCVSECCFPSVISVYKNDKLYVEVTHGKGITKFLDNNGVYWHLVE